MVEGELMGYSNLITQQVRKAFIAIKDLAVDITLVSTKPTAFNFGTNSATTPTATTVTTKGVVTNKKRKGEFSNTISTELLLKSTDIADPTLYDKVIIAGVEWSIVPPYVNDGYLITVNITKES